MKKLDLKYCPEPEKIEVGDYRVRLGYTRQPPKVDCRVIAEELYQHKEQALKEALDLINNVKFLLDNCHLTKKRSYAPFNINDLRPKLNSMINDYETKYVK